MWMFTSKIKTNCKMGDNQLADSERWTERWDLVTQHRQLDIQFFFHFLFFPSFFFDFEQQPKGSSPQTANDHTAT